MDMKKCSFCLEFFDSSICHKVRPTAPPLRSGAALSTLEMETKLAGLVFALLADFSNSRNHRSRDARSDLDLAPPARGARLLGLRYRQVPPSHPLFESIIYSSNLRVGGWDFQKPKDLHQKPKEVKMETEKADKSKHGRLPRSPKGEGRLRPRNASSPSPAQRRAESAVRGDQDPALDVEQRSVAVQWQAGQDRRGGGQD